ncbi:hypothetical protein [Bacillus cereus]|uniref:hypothetical protein n=1 Tax=Bacillus cereus TaxID=1396 RepID=UPI0015D4C61F|nr:hypothetical protein [Bacillus cereus]
MRSKILITVCSIGTGAYFGLQVPFILITVILYQELLGGDRQTKDGYKYREFIR